MLKLKFIPSILSTLFVVILFTSCTKKTEIWKFDAGETAKFQTNPTYSSSLNAVIFWSSYSETGIGDQETYVIPKVKNPGSGIHLELDKKVFRAVLRAVDCVTGKEIWTSSVLGESDQNISSPIIFDGLVYVGSDNGKLYALDEKTGAVIWSYDTKSWVYSTPFADDMYITCANENGFLYVFDRNNRTLLWKKSVGETDKSWIVANGIVYGIVLNSIMAFDVKKGTFIKKIEIADKYYDFNGLEQKNAPIVSELVIANGYAYCTALSHYLYKINIEKESLVWQTHLGKAGYSTPVVTDEYIYIGTAVRDVLQVKNNTGAVVRRFSTDNKWLDYSLKLHRGGPINGTVAIDKSTLYFGSYDYGFYAYDIPSGKRLWKYAIKHHIDRTTPIITDTHVIFGADSHHLYALER